MVWAPLADRGSQTLVLTVPMALRVAQITKDWSPNGGVATYVRNLSVALDSAGHDVTVVHADAHAPPVGAGVREVLAAGFADYAPASARRRADRVLEELARLRPDIVHVHGNNNFELEAGLRQRYATLKTLHTFDYCPSDTKFHFAWDRPCQHSTGPWCLPRMAYKRCLLDKRLHVLWRAYRRAMDANRNNAAYACIIVASEYVRRHALASGYRPDQVVSLPYFTVVPDGATERPDPDTVLFCGRLAPEKGLASLLRALARVRRRWRLVVAGDGRERGPTERLARRLGMLDRVSYVGWANGETLTRAYTQAALVAMPSRWPEPFGLVGLEAMAFGRPVVAFATGAIPEWLDDGVTGLLVRPGDIEGLARCLDELLDSPDRAREMGERGRARVASAFEPHGHVRRLIAIYDHVRRHARAGVSAVGIGAQP